MKTTLLLFAVILATVTAPDLSIKDVAIYLGVNEKTVRNMLADGRLKGYRLGKVIRFRRSDIDKALQSA